MEETQYTLALEVPIKVSLIAKNVIPNLFLEARQIFTASLLNFILSRAELKTQLLLSKYAAIFLR